MLNRIVLYITKNFGKMISTLIMFIVMISLLSTLVYTFITISNRVDDGGVIRSNYVMDDEKVFSEEGDMKDGDFPSYVLLYEKMNTLDGLQAYKIDSYFDGSAIVAQKDMKMEEIDNAMIDLQIADDSKQMDFYSKKVEIVDGSFSEDGVVISEECAEKYGLNVGDEIKITSPDYMYDSMFVFEGSGDDFSATFNAGDEETISVSDEKKKSFEVSGIYAYTDASSREEFGSEIMYIPFELKKEYGKFLEENKPETDFSLNKERGSAPDFDRFMAQYDNEESMKELDKFVADNYKYFQIVDSSKIVKESLEPLGDFKTLLLVATIIMIIVSVIGIYLNMYLKLDKRKSEFTALLGFGINSTKLSIQVFLEQLVFLIISVPFVYLIVNSFVKFVIELIKKYFIILIGEQNLDLGSSMYYEYISVDPMTVVDFDYANIHIVIVISIAIITLSLLVLTFTEVGRRFRNLKKV